MENLASPRLGLAGVRGFTAAGAGALRRRELTEVTLRALRELWGEAIQPRFDEARGLALACTGSLARGDGGPLSDLDLVLLHDPRGPNDNRHDAVGELAQQLEPDLTEARGGLRDMTALTALTGSWRADRPHGASDADELFADIIAAARTLARARPHRGVGESGRGGHHRPVATGLGRRQGPTAAQRRPPPYRRPPPPGGDARGPEAPGR